MPEESTNIGRFIVEFPQPNQTLVLDANGIWRNQVAPAGVVAWGTVTGTLAAQADLQAALDTKSDAGHTHAQADVTNLVSDLAGKSSTSHNHALSSLTVPVASVDFNGQQATNFRIENRTSDPGSPAVGQIWLRTDL